MASLYQILESFWSEEIAPLSVVISAVVVTVHFRKGSKRHDKWSIADKPSLAILMSECISLTSASISQQWQTINTFLQDAFLKNKQIQIQTEKINQRQHLRTNPMNRNLFLLGCIHLWQVIIVHLVRAAQFETRVHTGDDSAELTIKIFVKFVEKMRFLCWVEF